MSANVRTLKRRPAKRPQARTVTVSLGGEYEGWECTARADFPARVLMELESGKLERIIPALDVIIVDHNFPNAEDEIAASMADVEPYAVLEVVGTAIFDAIAKLPNR